MAAVIQVINKDTEPDFEARHENSKLIFDPLFERISLEQSKRLRYVRVSEQLANLLTEGTCSTQQWAHFLSL